MTRMPIDIQKIKESINSGKINWTEHVAKRLINRHISPDEVLQALSTGMIIEDYPSDYPFPSCLVLGCTIQKRKLHIVCSIVNDDTLTIITAYEPDFNKWDETFMKRRNI